MKKIMIVDDSRFMRDEIAHLLEGSDYKVAVCCRDAEEAMVAYHDHLPDLVLMDVVLPGIDGFEATAALIAKWPDATVVVNSSLAYDDTTDKAKKAGAKHCLFKPFTREELLAALDGSL